MCWPHPQTILYPILACWNTFSFGRRQTSNLRECDLSGVFMPYVCIVFLLLMPTLSVIHLQVTENCRFCWTKIQPRSGMYLHCTLVTRFSEIILYDPMPRLSTTGYKLHYLTLKHLVQDLGSRCAGGRCCYSGSTSFAPSSSRSQW